tara:strand:- start:563 stop:886 length:324 start_codon:yes stop_codon:yes gene_type:complete
MEQIQENPLLEAETIETIEMSGEDGIQLKDIHTLPDSSKEIGGEIKASVKDTKEHLGFDDAEWNKLAESEKIDYRLTTESDRKLGENRIDNNINLNLDWGLVFTFFK